MKTLLRDLKTISSLALAGRFTAEHSNRLEAFYRPQAEHYDSFREHLLKGRKKMIQKIPFPEKPNGTWIDFGAGTGANLEHVGIPLYALKKVYLVDLSPSLLDVAKKRVDRFNWKNVELRNEDVCRFSLPEGRANFASFSYSLTMIPNWMQAIDNAVKNLGKGGYIGVVDFFVSHKFAAEGEAQHSWFKRSVIPLWFSMDNVFLNPDHIPYLKERFETVYFKQSVSRIPYLPLVEVPYYIFVGKLR